MEVGDMIREARIAKGMRQEDVHNLVGAKSKDPRSQVSKWETNKVLPGRKTFALLVDVLELDHDQAWAAYGYRSAQDAARALLDGE